MIALNYDSAIQKYLRPGEQVFWVGQPRQGWAFRWWNRLVFVQILSAVIISWWLMSIVLWIIRADGPFPVRMGPGNIMVLTCVGATVWQLIHDKQRRANTWYAVTDQRVLFVLTNVWPESVIGIEYNEIVEVSAHGRFDRATPGEGTLKILLKSGDPYIAASTVLGYQVSAREIVLETVPDVQDFCDWIEKRRVFAVPDDWPPP
jgi:hypothetical protein